MDSIYQSRIIQIALLGAVLVFILIQVDRCASVKFSFQVKQRSSLTVNLASLINKIEEPVSFHKKQIRRAVRPVFRFVRKQVGIRKAHDYVIYLKGIVWDASAPSAIIAVGNAASELHVRPGQRIGDILVEKIARDHIVLRIGSRRVVKSLK